MGAGGLYVRKMFLSRGTIGINVRVSHAASNSLWWDVATIVVIVVWSVCWAAQGPERSFSFETFTQIPNLNEGMPGNH